MAPDEKVAWTGGPSQLSNLGLYALCTLLCWLVVPVFVALWRWLQTRCTVYELTDQRLIFKRGVLSKTTDDLELYRVRDSRFQQSLFERLFGLGEVTVYTTDETTPVIRLRYIRDAAHVRETLRTLVEARRDAKRVRYLDAEGTLGA